jgi:uncharacterized heparinase superfamily protein
MAAAALQTSETSVFAPAFARLTDAALLEHFRTRERPLLFVVEEPEEITPEKIAGVMAGVFSFNHETHALGHDFDWFANPSPDPEWHILLHKFYYGVGLARAFEASGVRAYLERWVALTQAWLNQGVPADFIAADVTGRRLQNWVYAWSVFVRSPLLPAQFHRQFLESVHAQTERLLQTLHKARNHRTLELYAVFLVAVAFPEFADARGWRALALKELEANAAADFQADGAHCEQSTHYHCIVLRNFLHVVRLARLNDICLSEALQAKLRRALVFAMWMHRPDGEIPALSDADGGSYLAMLREGAVLLNCQAELLQAGAARAAHFADSGYVVLRSGDEPEPDRRYLAFDAGHTGEGNHGHLDALSVEIYAYGAPIVVDPGRYTYAEGGDNWRAAFRGTAAHSTVQVDGRDQARYEPAERKWKITGPRARASVRAFASAARADYVHGEVVSAQYEARHERRIFFVDGSYWLIVDALHAEVPHRYDLRYQLAPEALGAVAVTGAGCRWQAETPHADFICLASHAAKAAVESGWVSRRYGEKRQAPRLRFTLDAANCVFATLIAPSGGAPVLFSRLEQVGPQVRTTVAHAAGGVEDALSFDFEGGAEITRRGRDGRTSTLLRVQGGRA